MAYGGFDVGAGNAPAASLRAGQDHARHRRCDRGRRATAAKPGDVIDVNLHVAENDSGTDRTFNLQSILPSGLTIVPGSSLLRARRRAATSVVSGNTVTIAGTQVDSENWPRTYNVTTSDSDPLCRTPILTYNGFATTGGHIGLYRHLGIAPGRRRLADGNSSQAQFVDLSNYWDGGWALYNNSGWHSYPGLDVSAGLGEYRSAELVPHRRRHQSDVHAAAVPVVERQHLHGSRCPAVEERQSDLRTVLEVARTPQRRREHQQPGPDAGRPAWKLFVPSTGDVVMEWIGAKTYHLDKSVSPAVTTTLDDHYDIDLVVNKAPRYADGQYELMMTYDNINWGTQGSTQGMGSIGIQRLCSALLDRISVRSTATSGYQYAQQPEVDAAQQPRGLLRLCRSGIDPVTTSP